MNAASARRYDVAIVGAGPVGSLCALAHARTGARVILLEANPKASTRLAGEWLHPPAVRVLRELGVDLGLPLSDPKGKGFAVFPEDGTEPIVFPYPQGARGMTCEHASLVSNLREAVARHPEIEFLVHARVREVEDGRLTFSYNGTEETVMAPRIVGADGQASVVRQSLGLSKNPVICSQTVGVVLSGVSLPMEGYGHVLLGGPGPVLIYRLDEQQVRLIVDVPLERTTPRDRIGFLLDSYTELLPRPFRPAFVDALRAGQFHVAANKLRPRLTYGSAQRVLIGDAAGHYHPMTAMGMTFGFGDALALAESDSFRDFTHQRIRATRGPAFLAMGLYEVFADHRAEAVAFRHTIYRSARTNTAFRDQTVRLLACEDTSAVRMGIAFVTTVVRAIVEQVPRSWNHLAWRRARDIVRAITVRLGWFLRSMLQLSRARSSKGELDTESWNTLAGVLQISMPAKVRDPQPSRPKEVPSRDATPALQRASARLLDLQDEEGGWEGEMVWCPMLTAQYVLLHHIIGRPLEPTRRRLVLRSFEHTRLEGGTWGMHEHSRPHLFVTTLVYVAARLLGTEREDPLLVPARQFLHAEGVLAIPSWGKFWLALLNLYDWRGVNAVLPELWSLPRWIALHPSNWYCHTRLIYMAMSVMYSHRFQTPVTPLITSLREELYPQGYDSIDFDQGRNRLRDADLFARPGVWLRAGYRLAQVFERYHGQRFRDRCVEAILRQIRWELQTTSHTSISPVSGILNMLALWLRDPDDPDLRQALDQLEGWIWEDEEMGARVTGARSASWDTGFALQALASTSDIDGVEEARKAGAEFLYRQQITTSFEGYREAYRNDPRGGWCFAGGWHGWPVSDCTAEAVLGLIATHREATDQTVLRDAIRFMLRAQNRDGGFGSYESQRSVFGLEWLNPAEMFGESMTEHSYIECTASCLAAFAACREHFPKLADRQLMAAILRADTWIRGSQASDGSWRGVWGVQFIYGTLFGIRGLLAAGAGPGDPALRQACQWLLERQRDDGGWGEHHSGCLGGRYIAHQQSQVIQTAWALIALLEAGDSSWNAISRGARFLLETQQEDGSWPRQDMAGVFFRTALLDYVLYRQYFPLHALGLYEQRRRARQDLTNPVIHNVAAKSPDAEDASKSAEPLRSSA